MAKKKFDYEDECVNSILNILNKKGCKETDYKIRKLLGLESRKDKHKIICVIPSVSFCRTWAIDSLIKNNSKKNISNNPILKKLIKDTTGLRDCLVRSRDYLNDEQIINLLKYFAKMDTEVPDDIIMNDYNQTYDGISRLIIKLSLFMTDINKKKGRPSLKALYDYIYKVACIYEELSGDKFTIYRHSITSDKKEYIAVTPGHRFVQCAVDLLHAEGKKMRNCKFQYTDKNIYNTCEKVVTELNKKKTPR